MNLAVFNGFTIFIFLGEADLFVQKKYTPLDSKGAHKTTLSQGFIVSCRNRRIRLKKYKLTRRCILSLVRCRAKLPHNSLVDSKRNFWKTSC